MAAILTSKTKHKMAEEISSCRYCEKAIDDLVEEYTEKFGGEKVWRKDARCKSIQVNDVRLLYDYNERRVFVSGNMLTARSMFQILQIKREN